MKRVGVVVAIAAAGACSNGDLARPTSVVRDSAGVRIIENSAPASSSAPFSIDTNALFDLGGASGRPREEFSGFVFPVRLNDGRIVVANGGSHELRVFDSAGRPLKPIGRNGDGPGEFRSLAWLSVGAGDTLRTYDWDLLRVSVFSADGAFRRSMHLNALGEMVGFRPVGVLADGRLIFSTQDALGPGTPSGVHRDTVAVVVFDGDGRLTDSVGRYPGSEVWIVRSANSVSMSNPVFGKELFAVAHQSQICIGTADRPELDVRAPDGRLLRIVRWAAASVPVSSADLDAYINSSVQRTTWRSEANRDRYIARLRQAPLPETKPAYAGIVVNADGSLWVRNYNEPAFGAPLTFEVFDSEGVWQGAVQMPARFTPTQIAPDFVLGTWRDEDDVQHVRVYRIIAR